MNSHWQARRMPAVGRAARAVCALLVATAVWGWSEAGAQDTTADCTGTYVIEGKPLIRDGMQPGEDAVVLEINPETGGTGPAIAVRSGCPPAPLQISSTRGRLIVEARLDGCAGIDGPARLRARLDRRCQTMRGRFSGRLASGRAQTRRRFTAERDRGAGGRVVGTVSGHQHRAASRAAATYGGRWSSEEPTRTVRA